LAAIVAVESQGHPWVIHVNAAPRGSGTTYRPTTLQQATTLVTRLWAEERNLDIGLGQINRRTAQRYGLSPVQLLDPCVNLWATAWHLREKIAQHGYSWRAIERYNGINPRYPWRVYAALRAISQGARGRPDGP